MKGLFWNIRGMGNIEKTGHLQDLIRDHKLNFVAILETVKHDFSTELLNKLSSGRNMHWCWMAARGRSGGILVGMDKDKVNVLNEKTGKYFIRLKLSNADNKKVWDFMAVYGAAQAEQKAEFLTELAKEFYSQGSPLVVGGDFNILRKESEKNKIGGYTKWSFIFNSIIDQENLREVQMSGRQFTWCNFQDSPTLEKLDRVFINNEWEDIYPLTTVRTLVRAMSDHNPMLMETGQNMAPQSIFRFEQSWFLREDLTSVVEEIWNSDYRGDSMERWQKKLKFLRKKLKGWNKNWEGEYRRRKKEIMDKIEEIDILAETVGVDINIMNNRRALDAQLRYVVREEKIKWFQRCKEKEVLEGDCNTKYYHTKANGRKRKSLIHSLVQEDGVISGQQNLLSYITSFYEELFGHSKENNVSLNMEGVSKVKKEDIVELTKPFSLEEVKKVVFELRKNRALGPDGFPGEFYMKFWDIIKNDLLELINDFHKGLLSVERLNYGIVTLVPKTKDAAQIQKFRPIYLLNVSFKIITKVLMNRLDRVMMYIISKNQTAFLKNRFIMEGIVILHELLNSLHSKKQSGILFKVDFEKAYDKVD